MSHYKSHNIKATCHICKVTFRRLTSLSTHLDNAHSPPLCKKCHQSFSNVWELNKHAGARCIGSQQSTNSALWDSVSELRPKRRIEMKPERPETSENSVEYIVGEDDNDNDMESDCEKADESTSSASEDENETRSNSSSTDHSSDDSYTPLSQNRLAVRPRAESTCATCGRGPFRSMKLHLLHCSGVRVKYQCSLCKELFLTEVSLNEHYMSLYSCHMCGQVFPNVSLYRHHPCPNANNPDLALFCSETMPKACNICKSFFTSERTLLNHVTKVHTSVVSTKVCIITNPSALNEKTPGVPGTAAQSATSSPNVINQVINGKLRVGQTYAGSLSTVVKSSPSSLSTSSSHSDRRPAVIFSASAAAPVGLQKDGTRAQPASQPSSSVFAPSSVPASSATDTTQATTACDPVSQSTPTIMAIFENDSKDVALMKRMNTGWRSKATYPCRQCGAIFRQPSLIISHRYLHRGRRSHQCQCGRAFKHRLHLLRHCVQHAENLSYICVSCGETFTGAKLLAEHIKGKSRRKSSPRCKRKGKVKRKCKMPFTCDCGQLFFRPSAYIWHQLQNRTKTKRLLNPLK